LVISKASQREQAVRFTTLSRLASLPPLAAPALLLVGRVVMHSAASANALDWLQRSASGNFEGVSIS
jgi:siroheme synthase